MNLLIRPLALALSACLLLGGCRDKHEPVKPTVALSLALSLSTR